MVDGVIIQLGRHAAYLVVVEQKNERVLVQILLLLTKERIVRERIKKMKLATQMLVVGK
jgi:hypothetical protein